MHRSSNLALASLLAICLSPAPVGAQDVRTGIAFREVWAYLMNGEERFLAEGMPITDLCYFSAEINVYGELDRIPDIRKLSGYEGRKHLVIAEIGSYSLTHFCLDPAYGVRPTLTEAIIDAAAPYDGVQIDFEAVPVRDRENFVGFLADLKKGLGKKTLSVALPARLDEAGDTLGYARIAAVVDRIVIMAYDEHWSTSAAGPVASMDWCGRIAAYASLKVEPGKLIMGLPFYGRAWGDVRPNRAYKHSGIESLASEKGVGVFFRENYVPWFRYEELVSVDVYYDDAESLSHRMRLYRDAGVGAVAFWRLGQEDPVVWSMIALE
ncbi:MAG: glycoside hydrolase [Spirochaetae bacterium HGW-Spirochaetae-3]|jgi:spore germination protein YaaH|nr:MAG: glycoside hydrolase [Spirochaetae bacterium HGW-Spirochaetae-3]